MNNLKDFELIKELYQRCKIKDDSNSLFYYIINILKTNDLIDLPDKIIEYNEINNEILIPKLNIIKTPISLPRYKREFTEKKCLGFGAFGCVYLVQNLIDFKEYAIKKIFVKNSINEINSAMSEIFILSGLENKNIVRYYTSWIEPVFNMKRNDFFRDINDDDSISYSSSYYSDSSESENSLNIQNSNNSNKLSINDKSLNDNIGFIFYIQTEYCNANNLDKWLRNRSDIDMNINYEIFNSLLESISYIHDRNIIHRDIKPSNIFMNTDSIKLGDFGLSTFSDISYMNSSIGSQLYLDPTIENKKCFLKMDIYSLGVILTELFLIFKTESERFIILNDLKNNIVPTNLEKKYPDIYLIIKKSISLNIQLRYNIKELSNDFKLLTKNNKNLSLKL